MNRIVLRKSGAMSVACLLVASCGNPYALRTTEVNYKLAPIDGSITYTDPKLYPREALISERRREFDYLRDLLANTNSEVFGADVLREIQSITTLSASLGLKFDPAAGLNYRRDVETSSIQQEISALKLQLQLDQLRRDAALVREKMEKQEDVVNQGLGTGDSGAVPDLSSATTASSMEDLVKSVNALEAALKSALSTATTALTPSGAQVSPFDKFNDRAAYRNLINSSMNAASLDELHDRDGRALIRLNLTATVLPPSARYRDTFGMLRMEVEAPRLDDSGSSEFRNLYQNWLAHINEQFVQREVDGNGQPTGYRLSATGSALSARGDLFDVAYFSFSTDPKSNCPGIVYTAPVAQPAPVARSGLRRPAPVKANCLSLPVAVARLLFSSELQSNAPTTLEALVSKFVEDKDYYNSIFRKASRELARKQISPVGSNCRLTDVFKAAQVSPSETDRIGEIPLSQAVALAKAATFVTVTASQIDLQARKIALVGLKDGRIFPEQSTNIIGDLATSAFTLVAEYERNLSEQKCNENSISSVATFAPTSFVQTLSSGPQSVAIYQLGPKEQVQSVSTMARAAEAISLAASISGNVPSSGIGGDGNVNFGRSAVGKADALERVPRVVAFAEAAASGASDMPSFGWMMGPKVTLDPKKKALRLDQSLTYYDLSADLTVPGWWPYLKLKAVSKWAPKEIGRLGSEDAPFADSNGTTRTIRVPLAPNSSDFDWITSRFLEGSSLRLASIRTISPVQISACASNIALQITGDNIWRTSQVTIGGRLIDGEAVSILPDMRGLLVKLPTASGLPSVEEKSGVYYAQVAALTPYGVTSRSIILTNVKPDGTCKAPAAKKK